ncbi:MAG TPA: hypothetical protein PKO06_12155, partial [Candidatus Ozemobacteraceae bacterium]|nr:hypothetical protein [Candidatus Ozemobacteraceae bacterium]
MNDVTQEAAGVPAETACRPVHDPQRRGPAELRRARLMRLFCRRWCESGFAPRAAVTLLRLLAFLHRVRGLTIEEMTSWLEYRGLAIDEGQVAETIGRLGRHLVVDEAGRYSLKNTSLARCMRRRLGRSIVRDAFERQVVGWLGETIAVDLDVTEQALRLVYWRSITERTTHDLWPARLAKGFVGWSGERLRELADPLRGCEVFALALFDLAARKGGQAERYAYAIFLSLYDRFHAGRAFAPWFEAMRAWRLIRLSSTELLWELAREGHAPACCRLLQDNDSTGSPRARRRRRQMNETMSERHRSGLRREFRDLLDVAVTDSSADMLYKLAMVSGVFSSDEEWARILRVAADKGSREACHYLGELCHERPEIVPMQHRSWLKWAMQGLGLKSLTGQAVRRLQLDFMAFLRLLLLAVRLMEGEAGDVLKQRGKEMTLAWAESSTADQGVWTAESHVEFGYHDLAELVTERAFARVQYPKIWERTADDLIETGTIYADLPGEDFWNPIRLFNGFTALLFASGLALRNGSPRGLDLAGRIVASLGIRPEPVRILHQMIRRRLSSRWPPNAGDDLSREAELLHAVWFWGASQIRRDGADAALPE